MNGWKRRTGAAGTATEIQSSSPPHTCTLVRTHLGHTRSARNPCNQLMHKPVTAPIAAQLRKHLSLHNVASKSHLDSRKQIQRASRAYKTCNPRYEARGASPKQGVVLYQTRMIFYAGRPPNFKLRTQRSSLLLKFNQTCALCIDTDASQAREDALVEWLTRIPAIFRISNSYLRMLGYPL